MKITFYTAPNSSAIPVDHALRELDVPHERVVFDLQAGTHLTEAFGRINPNRKVPTLVVDGTPLFEALAILQWLGDTFGVKRGLWPAFDSPQRLEAVSWTTWGYTAFSPMLGRFNVAGSEMVPEALHQPAQREAFGKELQSLFGVLEQRLTGRSVLVGESYSLADLVMSNALAWAGMCGVKPEGFERVQAWLAAALDRPLVREIWGD